MREEQFRDIFLRPLYNDKFLLSEIDANTYDEVMYLSNKFCIPTQILNNLIYDPKIKNPLIDNLKNQIDISNLKKLINQREILKISKLYNENKINYVFLKGSAINVLCHGYVRYSRDLDILVSKKSLSKAYELLKDMGYKYLDPLVSDSCNFINQTHHLPVLSNGEGGLVEIHHRVTKKSLYEKCPLTELMLSQNSDVVINGVKVNVSSFNHLITHIVYHASLHHSFAMGPVFLYDIKYLKKNITSNKDLKSLLKQMDLLEVFEDIEHFIDNKKTTDSFDIYKKINTKISNEKRSKNIKYFFLSKNGFLDLISKIPEKFKYNEDLFQTSKLSIRFYLILLIQSKRFISKFLKN